MIRLIRARATSSDTIRSDSRPDCGRARSAGASAWESGRRGRAWLLLGAICGIVISAGARADDRTADRLLVDLNLSTRAVGIERIDPQSLLIVDDRGREERVPLSRVLAILPATDGPAQARSTPGPVGAVLELVDGQRLPGRLAGRLAPPADEQSDPNAIIWQAAFGSVRIALDQIHRIVFGPSSAAPAPSGQDAVVLANGDLIEGFVDRIGPRIMLERQGQMIEIDPATVAQIRLSNPATAPVGAQVWLADGTVLSVRSIATREDGTLVLDSPLISEPEATEARRPEPPGSETGPRLDDVRAIVFYAGRLRALASLDMTESVPIAGRRWAPAPRIRGGPGWAGQGAGASGIVPRVELSGPIRVQWALPAGAQRFSGLFELPPSNRAWGDCDLVVSIRTDAGTIELARRRINAERPIVEVNVSLESDGESADRIQIAIEPGRFGPIQDGLVIHRGLILLGSSSL